MQEKNITVESIKRRITYIILTKSCNAVVTLLKIELDSQDTLLLK